MKDLKFNELRSINLERSIKSYGHEPSDKPIESWLSWLIDEVGELNQAIYDESNKEEIADEIADCVIYLDLLSQSIGLNLGEIVRNKFNKTSDKINSDIKINQYMEKYVGKGKIPNPDLKIGYGMMRNIKKIK